MQDRFVGDIGDFGKYGLLRALTGIHPALPPEDRLSLGVVWCVPDEQTIAKTPEGHGQSISYLFNEKVESRFQKCDPALFNAMKNVVYHARNLQAVDLSQILGSYTTFYDVPINRNIRKQWLDDAVSHTSKAKIVFLDPDVGIADTGGNAPKQTSYQSNDAPKYIFLSEIIPFMHGKTVLLYQSFGRSGSSHDQMKNWKIQLNNRFPEVDIIMLKFKAQLPRAFIILPAADHAETIDERLAEMLDGPWGQHFTRYPGD